MLLSGEERRRGLDGCRCPREEKALSTLSRDEDERLLRERLTALEVELSAIYTGDKREGDIAEWLKLALEKAEVEETLLQFQRQLGATYGKLLLDDGGDND